MKKIIKKNTQLTLLNPKGAGRKPIHDKGIRHIEREDLKKNTALHLTIKIVKEKAAIKNKSVLKALHHAIKKARHKGLQVIHYTLEYDHIHLLVEASDKHTLGKGMQSLGISFSKGINKIKKSAGIVFKNRYHSRKLQSLQEIKNVLHYILGNGIKHKESMSIVSPYNSLFALSSFDRIFPGFEEMIEQTLQSSLSLQKLQKELREILGDPLNYQLRVVSGIV